MPANVYDCIAYSTKVLTFVSSGAVPSTISCALRDKSDAVITSVAATSSGNGHYYAVLAHPGSAQWVVNEWIAVINASTYISRQYGNVKTMEVD